MLKVPTNEWISAIPLSHVTNPLRRFVTGKAHY